ncbi:MAG: hypothetical protein ACI4V3_01840 [Faecousia sp.]
MEQLFKSKTIQQFKIMQWLKEQGITNDDIASAKLVSRNLIRLTNPAGQYMDVFCAMNNTVRILQVSEEREMELDQAWNECDFLDDDEYRDWYDGLAADEKALVDAWDEAFCSGTQKICEDILAMEARTAAAQAAPANIETEEFEM